MQSIREVENQVNKINFIRYNAIALGKIEEINLKFIEGLKIVEDEGQDINSVYYDRIDELSNLAQNKLNISNLKDFNKVMAFIELADLMLNRGIKDKSLDCLTAGFYGLKVDLESLDIFSWLYLMRYYVELYYCHKSKES